ncbi:MAG: tetratricopeptide repeat protein, partial [Candidatus Hermodarchaeota archaeon]
KLDEAEEIINSTNYQIDILNENDYLEQARVIAAFYNVSGLIQWHQNNLDGALTYFQKSLRLTEQYGEPESITFSLSNIGSIYWLKGDLDTALKYFQRSLEIDKSTGIPSHIAAAQNNVGLIYAAQGELDTAIEYYQQSLAIRESLGNPSDIAATLSNISDYYRLKGDLNASLEYSQKSLEYREKVGNDILTSVTLFNLLAITIDQHKPQLSQKYFLRMQELYKRTPNKSIEIFRDFAQALILKTSSVTKDRLKAQEKLNEIIKTAEHFQIVTRAIIYLCEILIEEIESTGEKDKLEQAKNLVDQLHSLSKEQKSFYLNVQALLIHVQFALVEGKLPQAMNYLDQAIITAEEKNLGLLIKKVDQEKQRLEENYAKWEKLIQENTPLQERLKQADIIRYIQDAQRFLGLE